MKHIKKRISKITNELMNYYFFLGATDIDINIRENDTEYKISFKGNYNPENKEQVKQLMKGLQCGKKAEMEEYYWELAGECDIDSELTLIGMMIDQVDIDLTEEFLEVHMYRYKS